MWSCQQVMIALYGVAYINMVCVRDVFKEQVDRTKNRIGDGTID